MNKVAPFLWFKHNAEQAAEFYLGIFPHARKLDEFCSRGVGPWPVGKVATVTTELEGQEMIFLNGGSAYQLNPSLSFFVRSDSQREIDTSWDKLIDGGTPMAGGWLTDRFGLCWLIVPPQHRPTHQPSQSNASHDEHGQDGSSRSGSRLSQSNLSHSRKTSANSHVKPPGPPQIVKRQ